MLSLPRLGWGAEAWGESYRPLLLAGVAVARQGLRLQLTLSVGGSETAELRPVGSAGGERPRATGREEAGRRLGKSAVGAEGTVHCPRVESGQYSRADSEGRAAADGVSAGSWGAPGAPLRSPSMQGGAVRLGGIWSLVRTGLPIL